jgi:V/A-type H+-transporting ATPase subunit D
MTATSRLPATRSNLVRLRRRLNQIDEGAALLRKKREALVRELFGRVRPMIDARAAIERQSLQAYGALHAALAARGRDDATALAWPGRRIGIELNELSVWGLRGSELRNIPRLVRTAAARGTVPGHGDAGPQQAAEEFERLVEILLEAAPRELVMRRLSGALSGTSRLLNTLEQQLSASLGKELVRMRRTLDEREREEQLRLKRIVASRHAPGGAG